jgi:hypothetical protein
MPDVAAVHKFSEALGKALDGYSSDLQRELEGTRQRLAEAMVGARLDRAQLRQVAVREFNALGKRAARIGLDYEERITGTVEAFVTDQLDAVRGVVPGVVDGDAIRKELRAEANTMSADLLGSTPLWVAQFATTFLSELSRMRVAGDDWQTATDQLLAVDLVAGRASAARSAGNGLVLEADLDVWTLAQAIAASGFDRAAKRSRMVFKKQAIAAIDDRTTDCCLRVHGQIQPMDQPFRLTGKPRFADRLQGPPFHWRCRTATTLYTQEMEAVGVPTPAMVDAARAELRAREQTGTRPRIWPSHATSGRWAG